MALINTTTTGILGTTVFGDGFGDLTVQKDGVTINKVTTAPAFKATSITTQSFSSTTWTKCSFGTKVYDTNSNYDTSTYRFTPTVAGYYFFTCHIYFQNLNGTAIAGIYKNGSVANYGMWGSNSADVGTTCSTLLYANGTTDYFECYGYQYNGSSAAKSLYNDSNGQHSFWQGFWVRA